MAGSATIWVVILVLGAGTYLMRLSFLGLGNRLRFPRWVLRHLRYAPHAVMPAMVVPMLAPQGRGPADWLAIGAAILALAAGVIGRSTLAGLAAGAIAYYGGLVLGVG